MPPSVLVVGGGISGGACAAALRAAGVSVTVHERGRAPGGRLAAPELHGRRVDLGAAYFTVSDDDFRAVVADWQRRGLVRSWTDTFDAFGPDSHRTTTGPMRWAAPHGLRSLARDLHGKAISLSTESTALEDCYDVTVLAMPDPQAARITDVPHAVEYEPVLALAAGWDERSWPFKDAAFVNDDLDISLVVDDGARRGDAAPVLVTHTTPQRARRHLDDPDSAARPVLAALQRTLGIDTTPSWTHVHRWTFAKPVGTHGDEPFLLDDRVGLCGDSWCPSGSPRVEAAWLSGHRLGLALAERLGGTSA